MYDIPARNSLTMSCGNSRYFKRWAVPALVRKAVPLEAASIGIAYAPSEATLTVQARRARARHCKRTRVTERRVACRARTQYRKPQAVLLDEKAERDAVQALSASTGGLPSGDCKQS